MLQILKYWKYISMKCHLLFNFKLIFGWFVVGFTCSLEGLLTYQNLSKFNNFNQKNY